MKRLGQKMFNISIVFILLFSGMSGLGEVLLNATEATTEEVQNEIEVTTSVDEETLENVSEETTQAAEEETEVVEETTIVIPEKSTTVVEEMVKPAAVITEAITEEEQSLLSQLSPNVRSLDGEPKDFLTLENTSESFIVFLKEDQALYSSATTVFSASAGKSVAPQLATVIVTKDDGSVTDEAFINTLTSLPSVESVSKNIVSEIETYETTEREIASQDLTEAVTNYGDVTSFATPNDPAYIDQWEMKQMQMPKVWELGTGKGVKIGIFDTGFAAAFIDTTGVEFDTNRILPLAKYAEDNTCYADGDHGTMVLSIAGAVKSNNGVGMAGVASGATFQPYMAGYRCSSLGYAQSSANFVKVYEHALATGVNIMNMSFGGTRYDSASAKIINRATSKGLISVASRGNEGKTSNPTVTNYPACYPGVLMSGAISQKNTRASFSTYGDCGNKNFVTAYGEDVLVTTIRNNRLALYQVGGTSFSSPIMAAQLAIMKSANPTATSTQLKAALLSTATDLGTKGFDQQYGYGGINPLAAVKKANPYIITEGDYIYYLNKDMTIKYTEKYASGTRVQIFLYHTGTKYGGATGNRIKAIFYVDKNNNILKAETRADYSTKADKYYTYHTGTKYGGATGNRIKAIFYVDKNNNILKAETRADYSTKADKYYTYHTGTKYGGATGNRIKTIFYVDKNNNIVKAETRADYSTKADKYYTYHTGTKYGGATGNRIKAIFYVDKNNNILKAETRADYSTKANKYYTYHTGTKYGGATGNRIKTIFYVDKNNNILKAETRADYSTKADKYYTYHTGTKYGGATGNRIKTIFYVDKNNNILKAETRADYSTKANRYYEYHTGTKYGGATGNRIKNIFYIDKNGYIEKSESRKIFETKADKYYYYLPNTVYGKNHEARVKK